MLDNWSEQNQIDLTKRVELSADISYEIRQTLYRIMQEALSNLARHSGAAKAEVHCYSENNFINLRRLDNGAGFSVQNAGKGNGLSSMKDRCETIGGTFNIESGNGQGTLIEAVFYIGEKDGR